MASSSVPPRTLNLPIRRARVDLVPAARGLAAVDGWLFVGVAAICAFGLVMVYSASEVLAYQETGNPSYYFERQLVFLLIGAVAMLVLARVDYHHLTRFSRAIGLITVVLLLAVLVPHVGVEANGSRRWFDLGVVQLEPSAIAVLAVIVVLGRWLSDRGDLIRSWRGVRDYCILLVIPVLLVLAEKDLGSTIVLAAVGGLLLFLAGARYRHMLALIALGGGVGWLAVSMEPYRLSRLTCVGQSAVINDPLNACWQGIQALYGLGSGGLTGVGLGNSIQKYSWLPEAHTDFIYAIIGEELGLIGTSAVVLGFTFLAWRGIRAALRAPDRFGALLAGGVTAWICVQAFINVAAVTVLIPTTGIPLPFISYGGSALIMNLAGMGILCNVSAQGRRQGAPSRANADSRGRDGRSPDPGPGGRRRVARLRP
ncbi:MAG: putative lipid II flippase FtsW [Candidatus Dormiibacterota bacterium]